LSATEIEKIIMGEELTDVHINLAQRLLRAQFSELNGLLSTLLQEKETSVIEKGKENVANYPQYQPPSLDSGNHYWE